MNLEETGHGPNCDGSEGISSKFWPGQPTLPGVGGGDGGVGGEGGVGGAGGEGGAGFLQWQT